MEYFRPGKSAEARLIQLRWLSAAAMMAVALAGESLIGDAALPARLIPVAIVVASLNATLHLYTCRRTNGTRRILFPPLAHLGLDLAAWTCFIFLSGGATNPLISVLLPFAAIGAMTLERAQAWLLAVLAMLAYTYLWFFHLPLNFNDIRTATHLHILGMWLVFIVSDAVIVWFIVQMSATVRQRDKALATAREQAIRNDWIVSMGSLAAGAAHELSTPLGSAQVVVSDLIDDPDLSPAARAELAVAGREIDRCRQTLRQLAQDATSAALIEADAWIERTTNAWVTLNPAIPIAKTRDPDLSGCQVRAGVAVERALSSLFDNARNAGATALTLEARRNGAMLELRIADNGPGLPPEAEHAFRAGRPVESETGLGVGLLLATTAIEHAGGRLSMESTSRNGTRLRLTLPLREATV